MTELRAEIRMVSPSRARTSTRGCRTPPRHRASASKTSLETLISKNKKIYNENKIILYISRSALGGKGPGPPRAANPSAGPEQAGVGSTPTAPLHKFPVQSKYVKRRSLPAPPDIRNPQEISAPYGNATVDVRLPRLRNPVRYIAPQNPTPSR